MGTEAQKSILSQTMSEISALGVFINFDNEHMHPPKYQSDPPPPPWAFGR